MLLRVTRYIIIAHRWNNEGGDEAHGGYRISTPGGAAPGSVSWCNGRCFTSWGDSTLAPLHVPHWSLKLYTCATQTLEVTFPSAWNNRKDLRRINNYLGGAFIYLDLGGRVQGSNRAGIGNQGGILLYILSTLWTVRHTTRLPFTFPFFPVQSNLSPSPESRPCRMVSIHQMSRKVFCADVGKTNNNNLS